MTSPQHSPEAIAAHLRTAADWVEEWLKPLLTATEPPATPGRGGSRPLVSRPTEQAAMANLTGRSDGWLDQGQRNVASAASAANSHALHLVKVMGELHAQLPWQDARWGRQCSTSQCPGTPRAAKGGPCSACETYCRRHGVDTVPREVIERRLGA